MLDAPGRGASSDPPPPPSRYSLEMGSAPLYLLCGGPHFVHEAPGGGKVGPPPHPSRYRLEMGIDPQISHAGVHILCRRLWGGGAGPPHPSRCRMGMGSAPPEL